MAPSPVRLMAKSVALTAVTTTASAAYPATGDTLFMAALHVHVEYQEVGQAPTLPVQV